MMVMLYGKLEYGFTRGVKVVMLLQTDSLLVLGRVVVGIAEVMSQAEWLMSHLEEGIEARSFGATSSLK
ncbi:hypothetical protein HBI56_112590 [Parastagonospora nodorum]|uniref:Uncharacterized protein n=1 Tax=Phaeosphaeria nodorum (strain SN15 / ATCC MYA-4574 / FGSC 10173) TaxID=321614 RepID=A0A7U2ETW9_PHANO|nr:hypothetical protein HBH56_045220 [Parastagonospora nodorum]QRC92706.1 hypothetical protein JI435_402870 [Parastagonospora nodorum SN15]KAH3933022.1 hypothetical protein HBH54_072970 [Parastagonospora nodorum]KAH3946270.1 hypothetical protein HBH53_132130 [Parastagonospora nodorum]KAH3973266.1 hypothetical protein HBH52_145010 [Parastagonospora nodorum]